MLIFKDVFRSTVISFSKMKSFTDFHVVHKPSKTTAADNISEINDRQLAANQSKMLPDSEIVPIHPHASMIQQASSRYQNSKNLKTKGCSPGQPWQD